jgi:hypothetical protein
MALSLLDHPLPSCSAATRILPFLLVFALASAASCKSSSTDDTGPGIEGDSDADDDADSDADADSDTDGDADLTTWYRDNDGDGYGDMTDSVEAAEAPKGYVDRAGDCNDDNADINPDAEEVCDGLDNDCDEAIDNDPVDGAPLATDDDGDGYGAPGTRVPGCVGVDNEWDCDDDDVREPQVVDGTASPSGADGTTEHPWTTIQEGIDNARRCAIVLPGTYIENVNFNGAPVAVMSVNGPDETVIDGSTGGPTVTFESGESSNTILAGFKLINGTGSEQVTSTSYSCGSGDTCTDTYTSWCGGGLYVDNASPTLHDLEIHDNQLSTPSDSTGGTDNYYYMSYGGGACFRNTAAELNSVSFWHNYAEDGGAVYIESTASVSWSQGYAVANIANDGGGIEVDGGTFVATNLVIAWNEALTAGGGVYTATGTFSGTNVVIGKNSSTSGGGLYASTTSAATMANSIIWGTTEGGGVVIDGTSAFTGTYNDVCVNTGGNYSGTADVSGTSGNISADPAFASVDDSDPTDDDWTLAAGSACIDAGDPNTIYNDHDGSRNDMGAFGGPMGLWR